MFYRLVIQNNPDGTLSGAAAYDTPTSDARPITAADLAGFMPDVDVAALGQKEAMEAAHAAAIAAAAESHAAALATQAAQAAEVIQAWRDAVAAKDAELAALADQHAADLAQAASANAAAVEAAKLAIQTNLDALVTAAEAAHASGDLDAIGAVIAQAKGYTTEARRAKLLADLAAAQGVVTATADKLAALA